MPHLDVDEAVCIDDEIAKSVETNASQSHEHTRVVQVVIFQVVGGRVVVFDECGTVGEGHHHDRDLGSADLWDAMHTNIFPCTFRAGWPHAVVTSTSKGAADRLECCERVPARLSNRLRGLMKWVFSAFVVLWNLRAIEGAASADLWPIDVFTKITPGKSRSDEESPGRGLIATTALFRTCLVDQIFPDGTGWRIGSAGFGTWRTPPRLVEDVSWLECTS